MLAFLRWTSGLVLALWASAWASPIALPRWLGSEDEALIIRGYEEGLAAVRAANPEVELSDARDAELGDETVLLVDYPAATGNPGARDVWCEAENRDWSSGSAISFRVKPEAAIRISVSFIDRNKVAYTAWQDLEAGVWQSVRIAFDDIRPNPYFQPPGAKKGSPIDVSDILRIGFAPQSESAGHLAISRFVVVD